MASPSTALRATKSRNVSTSTNPRRYKMKASTTIYAGTLVMLDSNSLAVPAIASVSNKGCVGVAIETVTSDASNAAYIRVEEGEFLLDAASIAQAAVGGLVYASDDHTVDETQGSNEPKAGILSELVSATSGWVRVERPFTL